MSAASDEATDDLVVEMSRLPKYRGWRFSYEYPGFFCYTHPDNDYSVFFTPDWEHPETLPIQVQHDDGRSVEGYDVQLPLPREGRSARKIFFLVRPTLDKLLRSGDAFRAIVVRFADDDSGRTFAGYTDDRRWNGFACPRLPLDEFKRVLDVLLEWGDEQHYTVVDDQQVRVHGKAGVADTYVVTAKLVATTDGDRWLFDCGGAWTFVEVES